MKLVLCESWLEVYQIGDSEYIMIDISVKSTVCVFNKHNNIVYGFTPCSAYCYANHNYYVELIEKIK